MLVGYTDTMSDERKRVVVLDTHAIIHRAYHALPEFRTNKGFPTGALYGLITMILKIIDELKPHYVISAYDMPEKTFRHEIFDEYKGTRKGSDDELVMQIERSRDVITAFNIPIYEAPGFEADDVLGTIVEQTKDNKDLEIIIASGDMDTMQLVEGDRVKVFTLKKGITDTILYDVDAVRERFSFEPELLPDYKGLRGDPSDNIPGIRGIGDKGATALVSLYGTIEQMYEALEKDGAEAMIARGVPKRTVTLLGEHREDADFSKILATIRRDAPVDFKLPPRTWREGVDLSKIEPITAEFEFRTLWTRVQDLFGEEVTPEKEEDIDQDDLEKTALALWLIQSDITNPALDDMLQYSGKHTYADAKASIMTELENKKLVDVWSHIELPIRPLVAEMKERGVMLDIDFLKKLSDEYHTELDAHEKKIFELAGMEFNIKSPKQMSEVLFETMGLPTKGLKKTAGGAYSTRESELEKLADDYEIIAAILSYREVQKLLSTYIDNLPDMVDENDRLHPTLLQAGTSTGRFSSVDPNIQNIPIRTKHGSRIRNAFRAADGYVLLACDYAQVELRVAAIMAQDEYLMQTFIDGVDVHTAVAARVFGVDAGDVTKEMRSRAKVINFGILYGMGVSALMKNLGTTRAEAQDFYNKYFEQFSSIESYMEQTKDFALEHGYTETLFGRRRYFPALRSRLPYIRAQAERMAINAPIQGTATADIIKLAMHHVDISLTKAGLRSGVFFVMQVHDELVFEVKEDLIDEVKKCVVGAMEGVLQNAFKPIETDVPMLVDAGVGKTWGEAK